MNTIIRTGKIITVRLINKAIIDIFFLPSQLKEYALINKSITANISGTPNGTSKNESFVP